MANYINIIAQCEWKFSSTKWLKWQNSTLHQTINLKIRRIVSLQHPLRKQMSWLSKKFANNYHGQVR